MYKSKEHLELLCKTKTDPKIARMYGVCSKTIFNWRKKFAISPFLAAGSGNRLYAINKDFFSEIKTPTQAYILGFICADGFVHKDGKCIGIYLKESDKELLEKIKLHMGSTAPLKRKIRTSGYGTGKVLVGINLCSKKLVSDLSNLGITNKKSLTVKYPPIKNSLDKHFIRGLFDGDGWIGNRQFVLCGNRFILDSIAAITKSHTGTILYAEVSNGYPRLRGGRKERIFLDWIYHNPTVYLKRKYLNYVKYWSSVPHARVASSPSALR